MSKLSTLSTKELFSEKSVRQRFEEMLGARAPQFLTSVLQIVSQNELLAKAEPMSVYNSAVVAATLDLPLNANLGFAYIVPYNLKQADGSYKQVAQFQMGYKGFIQLAQRSGQYKTISATPVYKGQLISEDPLNGYQFDWTGKEDNTIIGYAAYFKLLNGFEKTLYMTVEELNAHGKKFSQTFKKNFGLWKDDFDAMAIKTVLKLLISKYGPLSVGMQLAVQADQGVINDPETVDVSYADNDLPEVDEVAIRAKKHFAKAKTIEQLEAMYEDSMPDNVREQYDNRFKELTNV